MKMKGDERKTWSEGKAYHPLTFKAPPALFPFINHDRIFILILLRR